MLAPLTPHVPSVRLCFDCDTLPEFQSRFLALAEHLFPAPKCVISFDVNSPRNWEHLKDPVLLLDSFGGPEHRASIDQLVTSCNALAVVIFCPPTEEDRAVRSAAWKTVSAAKGVNFAILFPSEEEGITSITRTEYRNLKRMFKGIELKAYPPLLAYMSDRNAPQEHQELFDALIKNIIRPEIPCVEIEDLKEDEDFNDGAIFVLDDPKYRPGLGMKYMAERCRAVALVSFVKTKEELDQRLNAFFLAEWGPEYPKVIQLFPREGSLEPWDYDFLEKRFFGRNLKPYAELPPCPKGPFGVR